MLRFQPSQMNLILAFFLNVSLAIVTKVTSISGVMPNNGKDSLPFDDLTMFLYDLGNAPNVKRALPPVRHLSVTFRWKVSAIESSDF